VIRNWLACGAPVVATTDPALESSLAAIGKADFVSSMSMAPRASWTALYADLIEDRRCASCHSVSASPVFFGADAGMMLELSADPDGAIIGAYNNLVGMDAFAGGACDGFQLVVPGSCFDSLLYLKVAPDTALPDGVTRCGDPMPPIGASVDADLAVAMCEWIDAGAMLLP